MRFLRFVYCFLLLCLLAVPLRTQATVHLSRYGLPAVSDTLSLRQQSAHAFDSLLRQVPMMSATHVVSYVAHPHPFEHNTLDFYLLLGLCCILGAIKTIHPKYFNDVWRAFMNPTLGNRQLRDIIQAATIPNMMMNVFSSVVLGTYGFYLISINRDMRFVQLPGGIVVSLMIAGALIVYTFKYAFIQFTGWAFNIRSTTEQYIFNIFLVNKIIGIALLPFIICFAFLDTSWDTSISIGSVVVLVILLLNRYLRSWNIFAQFFMNSRFHFFMYLCAFEISPLAILLKLVLRIL